MSTLKQRTLEERPATTTATATTVLVWLATLLGVELSAEVAVAIVALATAAVGRVTPRRA